MCVECYVLTRVFTCHRKRSYYTVLQSGRNDFLKCSLRQPGWISLRVKELYFVPVLTDSNTSKFWPVIFPGLWINLLHWCFLRKQSPPVAFLHRLSLVVIQGSLSFSWMTTFLSPSVLFGCLPRAPLWRSWLTFRLCGACACRVLMTS